MIDVKEAASHLSASASFIPSSSGTNPRSTLISVDCYEWHQQSYTLTAAATLPGLPKCRPWRFHIFRVVTMRWRGGKFHETNADTPPQSLTSIHESVDVWDCWGTSWSFHWYRYTSCARPIRLVTFALFFFFARAVACRAVVYVFAKIGSPGSTERILCAKIRAPLSHATPGLSSSIAHPRDSTRVNDTTSNGVVSWD